MRKIQRFLFAGLLCPGLVFGLPGCSALPTGEGSGAPAGETAAAPSPAGGERIIGHGEEVNLADHLVKGKTVIFDFFSEYCPPCRRISPLLSQLDEKRADIVVVKVDINRKGITGIDWGSPVAKQYGLQGIPHFKIYSPDGKLAQEGDDAYNRVVELLQGEGLR